MPQRVVCPNCTCPLKVPGFITQATIRCPGCAQFFELNRGFRPNTQVAQVQPAAKEATASPSQPPTPTLTSPHRCQHCRWPIECSIGTRKATVVCPGCNNKTSVYAVIYLCSKCALMLESPAALVGQKATCPGCSNVMLVPHDVLLEEPPVAADNSFFTCECPSCLGQFIANKADVGVGAVCPHCLVTLAVPRWGEHLEEAVPDGLQDPLASLHESKSVRCPKCHTQIPARAEACPLCGADNQ